MITSMTLDVEGYRITEYQGVVRGFIVRSPTLKQELLGGLKNIVGGQIGAYTKMCEQARQQACNAMTAHANQHGADAIVGIRYDASEVSSQSATTEVLCYGTAVKLARI